ncbi:MAG TPA: thioesterase family protein [Kineosporiaceae bacterium]
MDDGDQVTGQAAEGDRARPQPRSGYLHFDRITTRWMDNDVYGHVNNVVYYSFFDTAVNKYLIDRGALDIGAGPVIGLVVDTRCSYFSELSFPVVVESGLRVAKVGTSSVRYEVGLFEAGAALTAAAGYFVHVYVDRVTRRPTALPAQLREALDPLRTDAVGTAG